ncbi:MAG TPA: ABC transporter ATP-binding protein [Trinickia sp.]|uniref:ABC transporter ATP-binding protein n=1 Tax=Trinickia sp. TaxID=2571163 RepID=UPI002C777611|nr:ABC transporter ATP-binding protein [Trinickia sp.]HVW52264.1 ABC transporter ATP-binding protein [Trinickia sp.]
MINRISTFLTNLADCLALMRRAAPRAFYLTIATNILAGLVPSVLVYIGAQLIAHMTGGNILATVGGMIAAYVALSGFQDCLTTTSSFVVDTLRDAVRMAVKSDVNRTISTFPDLSIHEDKALRETAVLCQSTGDSIGDLISHLYAVSLGCVMIVPVALLTGSIAWWIPCVMLAGMTPLMIVRARGERASWDVQEQYASTFNELRILDRVLTQPEFAKDLRTYRMQPRLLDRWRTLYRAYLQTATRVRRHNALKLSGASLFASLCLAAPIYAIAAGFHNEKFAVADLAVFLGALVQMRDALAAITYNFGDLLGVSFAVRPYRKLLSEHAAQAMKNHGEQPAQLPVARNGLELTSVSFRYRNASQFALQSIDLCVPQGSAIAIVGDNGAGKSSLMKILVGFYHPDSGTIEHAISSKSPEVAGVFQDFAKFPLSVRDNLAAYDLDDRALKDALRAVGLDDLSNDIDIPLTTEIDGGFDLSGGQWQRLAIARAILHAGNSRLLVFDEPTSALDPESEADIMQLILRAAAGKTTFIVSHRLALTRFVDRIVVLEQGRIEEQGSHAALIEANGKYARMFHAQAQFYR